MSKEELVSKIIDLFQKKYDGIEKPKSYTAQRSLIHQIFVEFPATRLDEEILLLQDQLLKIELQEKGIVSVSTLKPVKGKIILWKGDITRLDADAIVNAANSQMLGCFQASHKCIDNVIHSAAGFRLRLACYDMMIHEFPDGNWDEPTGRARITPGFNLPSKNVIHTIGPIIISQVTKEDDELLASCYKSCLEIASKNGCKSIAFCCISTGLFNFPPQRAAEIAISTVSSFLDTDSTVEKVIFNVFLEKDYNIYLGLLSK